MASGASGPATAASSSTTAELSNDEINGVRLEKAVELGTKVYRDKFHETFPKDPAQLYTVLQTKKQEINRSVNISFFIFLFFSVLCVASLTS